MKKYSIILLLMFLSFQQKPETVLGILNKVNDKTQSKNNYKLEVDYSLYRGKKSEVKLANYLGVLIFKKPLFYNKVDQTETLISNSFLLKINHDEKSIMYSTNKNNFNGNQVFDLNQLLQIFKPGKLTEDTNNWFCELLPKPNTYLPYTSITLIVDKEKFDIKKQILYLNNQINFSKDKTYSDFDFTRLEIVFQKTETLNNQDKILLDLSHYVNINKNSVRASKYFKEYKIIPNN